MGNQAFYDAIICVKDMDALIGETLDCLNSCELPPRTIWVIDDGSSDQSAAVARTYPRTKVIENGINKGKPYSRNLGITSSDAPFIQLIDADDLIAPEKTANQIQFLQENPNVDVVFGDARQFSDSDSGRVFRDPIPIQPEMDYLEQLINKNLFSLHSFLFRRSYFEKVGLFDDRFVTSQDRELYIRAILRGCKMVYQPGNTAFYRRHENSTIASKQKTVAYYNALAVLVHAEELYQFDGGKYQDTTRKSLRMLARNGNRYLRSFKEIDELIQAAYLNHAQPIQIEQNALYNLLEKIIGAKLTERLLRPKFALDHLFGRYKMRY